MASPTEAPDLAGLLVGDAAKNLDETGHFTHLGPVVADPSEITGTEAFALANAWARDFAPLNKTQLAEEHGEPIDLAGLHACGRPLYGASSFDPLPRDVPAPYRRYYGSWWFVMLCSRGGVPQVSLAVSALASDLRIEDGHLKFPRISGNEFWSIGIPAGRHEALSSSPEAAAEMAAKQTGRRVSRVPLLVVPDPALSVPQGAVWRITFDRPARMQGHASGRTLETTAVYVGVSPFNSAHNRKHKSRMFVPALQQPDERSYSYVPAEAFENARPGQPREHRSTTVRRKPDVPIRFELAVPADGGN